MKPLVFLLGVLGLLLTQGCDQRADRSAQAAPVRLRMAFQVTEEELLEQRTDAHQRLATYLTDTLGLPVELQRSTGYGVNIEAMRAGKLDLCSFSPLPYLLAREKAGVEPLAVPVRLDGQLASYHSVIITHPATGLRSLEDLKARATDLTFAFADPASTSGHLIPRAQLETLGLDPERDFKQVIFSESHVVSLLSVRSRKVEVAAVTRTLLERMIKRGTLAREEITVLWESPALLNMTLVLRGGLPEEFRARVQKALLEYPQKRPEDWAAYTANMADPQVVLAPAHDQMFDSYRQIVRSVERLAGRE